MTEGHITKLDKCTSDCFIAPIVITLKKDDSIKLAMDAKPISRQLFKNKYQMPNVDELIDGVSQIVTENKSGTLYFTVLDLKYAYSQLKLAANTAKQCNFNIVGGKATGRYRFLTGFYGLADMPAEFQKAMDRTINHARTHSVFCMTFLLCRREMKSNMEHWWNRYLKNWMMKIWHWKYQIVNFQTTGGLVGTSPLSIRGQSKIPQNRSSYKSKSTEIA